MNIQLSSAAGEQYQQNFPEITNRDKNSAQNTAEVATVDTDQLSINSLVSKDLVTILNKQSTDDVTIKNKLNINLNMSFSLSNLKRNVDVILGKTESGSDGVQTADAQAAPILSTGFSAKAKTVVKQKVESDGSGSQDVRVSQVTSRQSKKASHYRLDNIKLKIQQRQSERTARTLGVKYQGGYRKIYYKLSQKYSEEISLKAELLDSFAKTTENVAQKQPESVGTYLDTTQKLADDTQVSAKTMHSFFNAVDSYVEKAEESLHNRIDTFLETILSDFNLEEESLQNIRTRLHSRVDTFFDQVDNAVNTLEKSTIKELHSPEVKNEGTEVPKEEAGQPASDETFQADGRVKASA